MIRPNWFLGLHGTWEGGELPTPPAGFRIFAASDWHLTVAFFGPVTETAAGRGMSALCLGALPVSPLRVTLGPVVPLGRGTGPEAYSALSALVDEGRDEVEGLIADVRDACCKAAGARTDTRPAKAHMTLLRPERRAGASERIVGLEWAKGLGNLGWRGSLDSVSLYTWSQDRNETLFTIAKSLPLSR